MIQSIASNPNLIPYVLDIVASLALIAFIGYTGYVKYYAKKTDISTACKYFADIISIVGDVPTVSPVIVAWMNSALKSICTGQPLPPPIPTPNNVNPAGLSWMFEGSNKVAFLDPKQWIANGGKILYDGGKDDPKFFNFAYPAQDAFGQTYIQVSEQGYYELEANSIHVITGFNWDKAKI